jgi:hypothetical protein
MHKCCLRAREERVEKLTSADVNIGRSKRCSAGSPTFSVILQASNV